MRLKPVKKKNKINKVIPVIPKEDDAEILNCNKVDLMLLMKRAEKIQDKCSDYIVSDVSNNFKYSSNRGCVGSIVYTPDTSSKRRELILSKYSFGQLCNKIGVPTQYMYRCMDEDKYGLVMNNITDWLYNYSGNFFIREYGGRVRGILTSRFTPYDTPEILDSLYRIVGNDLDVKGHYLTEERFHVRLTQPEKLKVTGEDLYAGITVDSSDVGRSTLVVNILIYKQVCSNGLIIQTNGSQLLKHRHIGSSTQLFREELEEKLDQVPLIISEVAKHIEKSRNSGDIFTSKDLSNEEFDALVKSTQKVVNMSDKGVAKVIELFKHRVYDKTSSIRYENNRWGLINAITEVAQDYTLEKRIELESLAERLLFSA